MLGLGAVVTVFDRLGGFFGVAGEVDTFDCAAMFRHVEVDRDFAPFSEEELGQGLEFKERMGEILESGALHEAVDCSDHTQVL